MRWTCDQTLEDKDDKRIQLLVKNAKVFNEEEQKIAVELVQETQANPLSGYQFIFARDEEGNILGYTCYGEIPLTDKRYDLYWIVVDPSAQGRGLSKEILRATEQGIALAGGEMLYAETSGTKAYSPAHRFYLREGFVLVSTLKDFYRAGDDKLVFQKNLA